MSQETYSLLDLDESLDEDRDAGTRYAPFENMLSATHLVTTLLDAQHGNDYKDAPAYAILGGFSMHLRGGRRSTRDVDLVTTIKMKGLWEAMTGQTRIIIPSSRLLEGILKVFIKTGTPHDSCSEQHRIEIDIMQAGFRGSPRRLDGNVERIGPFDLFGEPVDLNILRITQMMRIKVECCLDREEPRDFEDIAFMLRQYPQQVRKTIAEGVVDADDLREVLKHESFEEHVVGKGFSGFLEQDTWE